MKLPNFFVVGAIRCGTSSMRTYLDGHPQIFMAKNEPRFFSTDLRANWAPNPTEREYHEMFRSASERHIAVGDSSPIYLFSKAAVPNILNFSPNAKFVVMLRRPVDMVRSLHQRLLFDGLETEPDFEKAWRLQAPRSHGRQVPGNAFEPRMLQYGEVGALGTQLERMLRVVRRERVHLVFYDELKAQTAQTYEKVLSFVGVRPDSRQTFPVVNPNTGRRHQWLQTLLVLAGRVKIAGRIKINAGIATRLDEFNRVPLQRQPLRQEFREELDSFFRSEIELLAAVSGRDLSHWTRSSGIAPSGPKMAANG